MNTFFCFLTVFAAALILVDMNAVIVEAQAANPSNNVCAGLGMGAIAKLILEAPKCISGMGGPSAQTNSAANSSESRCCQGIQEGLNCACSGQAIQQLVQVPTYSHVIFTLCPALDTNKMGQSCPRSNTCARTDASDIAELIFNVPRCLTEVGSQPQINSTEICCRGVQDGLNCACTEEASIKNLQDVNVYSEVSNFCKLDASKIGQSCPRKNNECAGGGLYPGEIMNYMASKRSCLVNRLVSRLGGPIETCCPGLQDTLKCVCSNQAKQVLPTLENYNDIINACKVDASKIGELCTL